jgi:hypothetical protein
MHFARYVKYLLNKKNQDFSLLGYRGSRVWMVSVNMKVEAACSSNPAVYIYIYIYIDKYSYINLLPTQLFFYYNTATLIGPPSSGCQIKPFKSCQIKTHKKCLFDSLMMVL